MKRSTKLGLSLVIIVAVMMIISSCINSWLTSLVRHQLDQNIATADSLYIQYGDISLTVLTGKAWIKDVYFSSDTLDWNDSIRPVSSAKIDMLSLDGINYYDWIVHRTLHLKGLTITNPTICTRFIHKVEKETGEQLQEQMRKERQARLERTLQIARIFIDDATVDRITIDNANIEARAINDSLRVRVPEFTINIYDLGYNIRDEIPHFNDSVFHFLFRNVDVNIPKVKMHLTIAELRAKPNGVLHIDDVNVRVQLDKQNEYVHAGVRNVSVGGFDVPKFNTIKSMDIRNIHLYDPFVNLQIDESDPEDSAAQTNTTQEVEKLNEQLLKSQLATVEEFITSLIVDTIAVHDASIKVHSTSTNFGLQASQLNTSVYGLGYSLIEEVPYHYNDTVYQFYVRHVDVITPDSALEINANHIRYNNGKVLALGKTRIHHIINRWELAHLMGDIPSSWIDMSIDTLYTSAKNIVKEAGTLEHGFRLDTLYTDINRIYIFRDARHKPKEPYQLPQAMLMHLSYPFVVNHIAASVNRINIHMALNKEHIGKMDLGPVFLKVNNVTPIPNSTIGVVAAGKMGKADLTARFNMKVNQACNWDIHLTARNVDLHHLDNMVYPIVGMTIGGNIHHLTAKYSGDTTWAHGSICMNYDGLDVFADKNGNSPIAIANKLSGLINSANKTILHKANPAIPGKEPTAYAVKWKNDPWNNPALFYVGPIIDGCIENFLPGIFLHNRVKTDKNGNILPQEKSILKKKKK